MDWFAILNTIAAIYGYYAFFSLLFILGVRWWVKREEKRRAKILADSPFAYLYALEELGAKYPKKQPNETSFKILPNEDEEVS